MRNGPRTRAKEDFPDRSVKFYLADVARPRVVLFTGNESDNTQSGRLTAMETVADIQERSSRHPATLSFLRL